MPPRQQRDSARALQERAEILPDAAVSTWGEVIHQLIIADARSTGRFAGGHTPQVPKCSGWSRYPARTFERDTVTAMQTDAQLQRFGDPLRPVDEQRRRSGWTHIACCFSEQLQPPSKMVAGNLVDGNMHRHRTAAVAPAFQH